MNTPPPTPPALTDPKPTSTDAKIHPAVTVSNIKNFIPVLLEMETGQYSSWCELFRIHCRAFQVIDHLSPKSDTKPATTTSTDPKPAAPSTDELWDRLDAIVLQWIYSTISNDLLSTIIRPGNTAYDAWSTLEGLFHDNKNARAIHLMQRFATTRLDGFPNMSAYCQAIKSLADQLANVGAPVNNKRLVLHLLAGLTDQYEGISTILPQKEPTPSFYEARSQLCMIENQKAEKALYASQQAAHALTATTTKNPNPPDQSASTTAYRGRGRGRSGRGRGHGGRGRS
ncbi:putative RNA-directed DNA polymerase [Helianthus annuus]|nr:putative RNA-directed DNA polymerase [Helianthus annuus]KAJ0505782.1 putative RNA-directed DNA polymerase [Helianthus annuus]KAJ0675452.1 putative RNA-directed DNA polymerase [Helianthus annuus]KAJ0867102.1 putative RNA-directed DNA polymerase [Helianthus annuus]